MNTAIAITAIICGTFLVIILLSLFVFWRVYRIEDSKEATTRTVINQRSFN